jgi:hypothetical protein
LTQFTCGKITTKIALGQHPIVNNFNCKRRKKKRWSGFFKRRRRRRRRKGKNGLAIAVEMGGLLF